MRKSLILICLGMTVVLILCSCAKTKARRIDSRPVLAEFGTSLKSYSKKVGVEYVSTGRLNLGHNRESVFFDTMVQTFRAHSLRASLLLSGDQGFPKALNQWAGSGRTGTMAEIALQARMNGFNALLSCSLTDIRVRDEKKGFWFFQRTDYYVTITVTMDMLDPITSVKSNSCVEEKETKISIDDYQSIKKGDPSTVAVLDKILNNLAEKMGKQAAEWLRQIRWQASITQVQGKKILLSVGRNHGLSTGDRLTVFEGRRVVSGYQGEKSIAPGFKVGEIRIVDLGDDYAQGVIQNEADIQVGDIAVTGN
jgi:hypothetical protein